MFSGVVLNLYFFVFFSIFSRTATTLIHLLTHCTIHPPSRCLIGFKKMMRRRKLRMMRGRVNSQQEFKSWMLANCAVSQNGDRLCFYSFFSLFFFFFIFIFSIFSPFQSLMVDARLYKVLSRPIHPLVLPSVILFNQVRFTHYCPCSTVCGWVACIRPCFG